MYCKKCGSSLAPTDLFCRNCGTAVNQVNEENTNNIQTSNQSCLTSDKSNYSVEQKSSSNKKTDKLGIISLIIGIISLILIPFFNFLILPLAIIGLILGIRCKTKDGKRVAGIIINIISIIFIIVATTIILNSDLFKKTLKETLKKYYSSKDEYYVVGKYNCATTANSNEYSVSLHLNANGTFVYGPYGDLNNNYAKGRYIYEYKHKTNNDGNLKYYLLTMKGTKEEYIVDGKPSDYGFVAQVEMGVISQNEKKRSVIKFLDSNELYYCFEN